MKLILLYILLIQTSYGTSTFYKDDNFSLSIISKSDKNIINFEGLIRKPLVQEFKKLIRDSNTLLPIELRLNSEGGSIYETQQLISFINTLKEKNFTINTRVNLGSMCASSCVPIFVQGEVREAGSASSFMFHGVSVALITNIPEAESTQIMIDTYRDAGISERWIQKHITMGVWSTPNETWYSGKELFKNGSNFITSLLKNRILFSPYNRDFSARPK